MNAPGRPTALIAANDLFESPHAKTAHGLVRHTSRYHIIGVIDPRSAGKDAGEALDGIRRNIPIFASLEGAIQQLGERPAYCIVGVATHGGQLPEVIRGEMLSAVSLGISVVNGMHSFLCEDPEFVHLAAETGATLVDVRKPKPRSELRFWNGDIFSVTVPTLAVLGTDCAVGKRTTTQLLVSECQNAGIASEMVYTGQTGWMQGAKHGIIFDTLPNDFVSGELEGAVVACARQEEPDLIIIEGQSSLRNPSGPCGAEILLSARAKGVVLQHAPRRQYFDDYEALGLRIQDLENELKLIELYGSKTIGICLNTQGMSLKEAVCEKAEMEDKFQVPVVLPLEEGVGALLVPIRQFRKDHGN